MAFYIVHKEKIQKNIDRLRKAFLENNLDFQLFYSVKTNFADIVLRLIKGSGAEFEITSSYEWNIVKRFKPKSLVLNGPGKSLGLLKDILKEVEVLYFNVDNDTDINILKLFSKDINKKLKIGLRVYLDLKRVWNRFGYEINSKIFENKVKMINSISKVSGMHLVSGMHFHFSTNNFNIENYKLILPKIRNQFNKLKYEPEFLDIGGGLPAANEFIYEDNVYKELPKLISGFFPGTKIISEAGRNIVADAVDIEARVISKKKTGPNKFDVSIDINIMHFPCFFEKKFWVEYLPIKKKKKAQKEITIFGNSCMQIDKIIDSVNLEQEPSIGDKVIIHNVGAYSYSQASNFISKKPEVIVYE